MKKFVLLYSGYEEPTQTVMEAWGKFFESIASRTVDMGSPLGAGREITRGGTKNLSPQTGGVTGYTVFNAESLDEAEAVAKTCPLITSVAVYECMSM